MALRSYTPFHLFPFGIDLNVIKTTQLHTFASNVNCEYMRSVQNEKKLNAYSDLGLNMSDSRLFYIYTISARHKCGLHMMGNIYSSNLMNNICMAM